MSTDPIASIQEKLGERRHGLKLPNAVVRVKDLPSMSAASSSEDADRGE